MPYPVATQGTSIQQLLTAFPAYLKVVTEFNERDIVSWHFPSRPEIEGHDRFIWYRLIDSSLAPSTGPVRFGNKMNVEFDTTFSTRTFLDGSQRDTRKEIMHYDIVTRLLIAFKGLNLFPTTVASPPINGIWVPPIPSPPTAPLTVEPMQIEALAASDKTQSEEGTISTRFKITVPIVLNLTINPYPKI